MTLADRPCDASSTLHLFGDRVLQVILARALARSLLQPLEVGSRHSLVLRQSLNVPIFLVASTILNQLLLLFLLPVALPHPAWPSSLPNISAVLISIGFESQQVVRSFIDAAFGHSLEPGVSTRAGRGRSSGWCVLLMRGLVRCFIDAAFGHGAVLFY